MQLNPIAPTDPSVESGINDNSHRVSEVASVQNKKEKKHDDTSDF